MQIEQYGARIEKIVDTPYYTEGPAVDQMGNCYFSTLKGQRIFKINLDGNIAEWVKAGYPNGQFILPNGDHLVCDSQNNAVLRYNENGNFIKREICQTCMGRKIYTPNDVVADSSGHIYFTDSIRSKGKICFLSTSGKEQVVADNLDYPNGLVLSSDEKWLYIAESYKNRILKIAMDTPGRSVGKIHVFVTLPYHASGKMENNLPDGLTLDNEGNVWVAHYGMGAIYKIDADLEKIFSIHLPMPLISNLIFIEDKVLMVTGGYDEPGPGAVFKIYL